MKHPRLIIGVLFGALLLAACGTGEVEAVAGTSPSQTETTTTSPPPSTSSSVEPATSTVPETTVQETTVPEPSDRPIAPDFTLELGTGGTFTLSEGEKPVYLVFWAEW